MISFNNLTRKIITYFGLIQLNDICITKFVMFVNFVVCLLANGDGSKYCQVPSSKLLGSLFVFLSREKLLTVTFSVIHILLTGIVPLGLNQRQEIGM